MKLEIEFESEQIGDEVENTPTELKLEGRTLPYLRFLRDRHLDRDLRETLAQVHRLLPKDWNL